MAGTSHNKPCFQAALSVMKKRVVVSSKDCLIILKYYIYSIN